MAWCFVTLALISLLLGLGALRAPFPQLRAPNLRPSHVVRGCLAVLFVLIAGMFGGLALVLAPWPLT